MEGEDFTDITDNLFLTNFARTIYTDIIKPLTNIWSNGQVLEEVKNHLIIFKPQVGDMRSIKR